MVLKLLTPIRALTSPPALTYKAALTPLAQPAKTLTAEVIRCLAEVSLL